MKVVDSRAMRAMLWAIPVLPIGIIVFFDLLTPVGVAISILYVIPLMLTFISPRKRGPIYFSVVATAFIRIDLFPRPPGIPILYGVLNRTLRMLVLWGVALGLIHDKAVQKGLISAEVARAQAVAGRDIAMDACALSEAAATEALSARCVAEEKLLVSCCKLEGIIQSAGGSIIMVAEQQNIVRNM